MHDLLILQSCFDGKLLCRKSLRDESYGTPIIRELVKTLYKHSSHRDLATLFDIVQERVRKVTKKLVEKRSDFGPQVPDVTKTLTGLRKVLLFPKYKVCPKTE
ncbi:hypothetical protein EB796_015385 [Bugula neritina]|uniref:Caspase family p10 domain-containing protein n=1 Tax=Bugula neritina TaxID=10212 RepID=A0A7J7JLI7_BUGNE|nr:hypothetical protein EB796_015385 [Bugula neritina]